MAGDILIRRYDCSVEHLAGDLFRRHFGVSPPAEPVHFIAFISEEGMERVVGYTHFTPCDDHYLGGGMCIDNRVYRGFTREARQELRKAGGIAYLMLKTAVLSLNDKVAVFGYVGDRQAEVVDRRVGFVSTGEPHLLVYWTRPATAEQQRAIIEKAAAVGPF